MVKVIDNRQEKLLDAGLAHMSDEGICSKITELELKLNGLMAKRIEAAGKNQHQKWNDLFREMEPIKNAIRILENHLQARVERRLREEQAREDKTNDSSPQAHLSQAGEQAKEVRVSDESVEKVDPAVRITESDLDKSVQPSN